MLSFRSTTILLLWSGVLLVTATPASGQCELHEDATLTASDGAPGDIFGTSVSVDGDTAVVGAIGDDYAGYHTGSAYVFSRIGSSWVEQQKLVALDGQAVDEFGNTVSVSGDVAVVGAWADDDDGTYSGSAYVFRFDVMETVCGQKWCQEQKLLPLDGATDKYFGVSLSVSGDVLVVGAFCDTEFGPGSGAAYVFRYHPELPPGSRWGQEQKLLASDGEQGDGLGISVSVFGDTVVVGASGDGDNGTEFGAVYVFHWNGSMWIEEQKFVASDGEADDYFGRTVSLSGDTALVGAYQDDCAAGVDCGSAYVFRYHSELPLGSRWVEEQKLLASDGAANDIFGNFISLSGDVAVVGAIWDDAARGSAYVYRFNGSSWVEERKLTAAERAPSHGFGPVGVSGEVAFVGVYNDDVNGTDSGSVFVFELGIVDCNANGILDECEVPLSTGCPGGLCTEGCSQDNNEDCIPDECGACCFTGGCSQVIETTCETLGIYQGDETNCDQGACAGIPTLSEWGLVAMTLLVLTAGTVVLPRRRVAA